MRERTPKKRSSKRNLRMTKRECCLVWAVALGLAFVPLPARSADNAYGTWSDSDSAYVITVESENEYAVVYGYLDGTSSGGSAAAGKVTISGGSISGAVYGGYASGAASGNFVGVSGSATVTGRVYGGYSTAGVTSKNSVTISGGTLSSGITGGQSGTDSTTAGESYLNTVTVEGGDITGAIYGGFAPSANAYANQVVLSGGTVTGGVTGNYSVSEDAKGTYTSSDGETKRVASVIVNEGATVVGNVVGGFTAEGNAELNLVQITGGSVTDNSSESDSQTEDEAGNVYGAYTHDGDSVANTVDIKGGSVDNNVFGNYSDSGSAIGVSSSGEAITSVSVSGGSIGGDVIGGKLVNDKDSTTDELQQAAANSVIISDGAISGSVYGNWSKYGTATGIYTYSDDNSIEVTAVTISGGTIVGDVYAGNAENGTATYNTLKMTGGTVGTESSSSTDEDEIAGCIYGGYSSEGTTTYNTVSMSGGTVYGYVAGGYVNENGDANYNTVEISGTATVWMYVYGGKSKDEGSASYNSVKLGTESSSTESDSTVTIYSSVYGGSATDGNVVGNSVKVLSDYVTLGTSDSTASIYAGSTSSGYARANSILVAAGTITGDLWGNYANTKSSDDYACGIDSEGNVVTTVTITGGSVNAVTAGYSKSGTAYANSVDISDGTVTSTVRGNRTDTGTATGVYTDSDGNTYEVTAITVTGGTLKSTLYGGYANSSGTATANTVKISGGSVNTPYGGYSKTGTAYENHVEISGGNVTTVRGGGTESGEVYENAVTITGGTVTNIYGGYSSGSGTVHDNTISVAKGLTISGSIWGGYSESGMVYSSSVAVLGYDVGGSVYGGQSSSGTAAGNSVTVESGTADDGTELSPTVGGSVYGGYAKSGTAAGNSVKMTSGTIGDSSDGANDNIYGNYSESGAALGYYTDDSGNTVNVVSVTMTGGTVENTIYGGKGASATSNSVSISGEAKVGLYVVGGEATADNSSATDNTVAISGNAIIGIYSKNYTSDSGDYIADDADVVGGWATGSNSSATNNTVTISDSVYIYGNAVGAYGTDAVSGNSVVMSGGTITGNAEGGYSPSSTGTVTGNKVSLSETARVKGYAMGGYNSSSDGAEVSENSVTITDSAYAFIVYGGQSYGSVTENTVTITGTGTSINAAMVMGGYSVSSTTDDATGNTVTITSSVIKDENSSGTAYVYGAWASGGDAKENKVSLTSSTVDGSVYGGYASGTASGNSVSLTGISNAGIEITGSVYGGYGSTSTGNSVSIYGYVSVTGAIYGGNKASGATEESTGDYNTLWIASTENYAETLYNFDTITFDITGLNNGNTMLTLSADTTDLTGVSSISLYKDNANIAANLGEILYLIDTDGTISVTASSLQELEGTVDYVLDSENGTTGLTVDDASLEGYYTREMQVISYDDDNNIVEETADESGTITGEDLVLRVGDTVYVTAADFDLAEESDGTSAEYIWGTSMITLDEAKYVFSSDTTIENIGSLTVTGVEGTLIADSATSVLLNGGNAESVTDISTVSLESLNNISITYTPATGVTVTGTTYVDTDTLNKDSTEADSLVLVSSSIDTITFESITYISTNDGALINLDGTSTYNMSATNINVSSLTLVDSGGSSVTPSVDDEYAGEIVMTLIASNGSITNLGQNTYVNSGADISSEQTFGYLLTGSTYDTDDRSGASLEGTLTGYVISEGSSESSSEISVLSVASASEDDTEVETDTYDLVLKTGTDVAVTSVTFGLGTDSGTATVELSDDSEALITLNSELTYDFSGANLTDTAATIEVNGDEIKSTLLANDYVIVQLLATDGAEVNSLSTLSAQVDEVYPEYTYTPVSGVTVTGDVGTITDDDGISLAVDTIGTITFGKIEYAETVLTLDGESTYDLSGTAIDVSELTIVDDGSGAISSSFDGDELVTTLIDANGSVTNLNENEIADNDTEISQTFNYELIGTDSDGNKTGATLDGTLTGYVVVEEDESENDFSYDLVLRTGTTVTVTDVALDISSLDAEGDAQLTLSPLSYDFSELTSDGISINGADGETDIENASTLIDSITLIDGSSATDVTGMGVLVGYGSTYSYSIGNSIDVTGEGEIVISSDGKTLSYDILNILTLDFWIDEDTSTDEPMLTVETADLSGTDITAYAQGGDYLEPGYEIVLIEATEEDGLTTDDETTYTGTIYDGVSIEYELEVTKEDNTIVARVTSDDTEETEDTNDNSDADDTNDNSGTDDADDANDAGDADSTDSTDTSSSSNSGTTALRDETKSLAVTRLAQTAMIDQGSDLLVFAFDEAFMTVRERTKWTPYIAMSAGDFDYGTQGGSLDIESFHATIGYLRNTFDDDGVFSWGPVFQYGKADYDSYTNGVTASGETEYVGGGLFARRRWNSGTYVEGAITGGYSNADYGSVTILEGTSAAFSVGSEYWAAYAGLARDYRNGHGRTFKPYIRYNYSHLEDAQARLSSGELYRFGDVDSSRLSAGFRIIWDMDGQSSAVKDRYHTYLGAAYSYQFDGSAVGVYNGLSTLSPTMRGGSCMLEGGLHFRPNDGNMSIDLAVNAWFGNQEGIGGVLKFKWDL